MRVLLLADHYGDNPDLTPSLELDQEWEAQTPRDRLPSVEEVLSFDMVLVLGRLADHERAMQLSGVLEHALRRGRVVVVAYGAALDGPDEALVRSLAERIGVQRHSSVMNATATHPAFEDYFVSYGRSATFFGDEAENAETLGTLDDGGNSQTAFALPRQRGSLYVIPYHVADIGESHDRLVSDVLHAVVAHRSATAEEVPEHLADLRLPGEPELLKEIERIEAASKAKRQEAERLERFRLLLGSLSGDPLEALAIEGLNEVLTDSDYGAEDREDLSKEDFWIVGSSGDFALGEVKGVGTGVRREHANKLDSHREAHGKSPEELPGLLIVNQFRNDASLERRRQALEQSVVSHLARLNILALRTSDLYELLAYAMEGQSAAELLIRGLRDGGGWLEMRDEGPMVHS
jgi:hypothetical protein